MSKLFSKKRLVFYLLCFLSLILFNAAFAQSRNIYSQLWGKNGEKWDKARIPDFTGSGYQNGNKSIPVYKTGVNIRDFGAVGDGVTDDTQAFKKAIAACGFNKSVFLPAGTYRL